MVQQATYHGTEPASGVDCAVETLAENIDWLEHHIDTYGSIVAKSPDIWGEARLTKFRDEYERIMFRELAEFKFKINASIAQSDSAFLAQALALSAAATGGPGQLGSQPANGNVGANVSVGQAVARLQDAGSAFMSVPTGTGNESNEVRFGIEGENAISLEPVIHLDQLSRYLNHLHELRRINEGDDTSDSPGYSLNLVRMPVSILPGKLTRTGFGAEVTVTCTPVITDDLLPTTFHNLAVNDMVDLLGLPLVRTAEARIYGQIPYTEAARIFRLQTSAIERAFANENIAKRVADIEPAVQILVSNEILLATIVGVLEKEIGGTEITTVIAGSLPPDQRVRSRDIAMAIAQAHQEGANDNLRNSIDSALTKNQKNFSQYLGNEAPTQPDTRQPQSADDWLKQLRDAFKGTDENKTTKIAELLASIEVGPARKLSQLIHVAFAKILPRQVEESIAVVPTGRARRALNPLNPTFVIKVIGIDSLMEISDDLNAAYYGRYIRWKGGVECSTKTDGKIICPDNEHDVRVDLLDAQRFLQAELEAAYQLLSQPEHIRLFAEFASPCSGLAKQIRAGHLDHACQGLPSVEGYRKCFFTRLHEHCVACTMCAAPQTAEDLPAPTGESQFCAQFAGDPPAESTEARNTVEALAWALVVESALLNERLNLDVRKVGTSKQVPDLQTSRDYLFFLPETVGAPCAGLDDLRSEFQQATDIFKRYVEVRWPIHVFAVDPREQDQNVADVSARKRELQFALALGFVTGQIGVNSLTQYSRELQTQIETIALNRTVIGFGHGDDVFGWRFQPRVQGLYVPNNCGAVREILCGVSRDYDLRHRQLEPGQRDCTAIVLMPSFVPYADFDIRTNWYKLTNPKNAALTMRETVRLSRAITAMRSSQAQCSECATLYRENEVPRLMKRVEQLDRELPLQTQRVLVPYENTLGGFEMFNTGVTDLSPELIGWYGAPGIVVSSECKNAFNCGCTAPCTNGGVAPLVEECVKKTNTDGVEENVLVEKPKTLPICEGAGTTVFLVGDNFSVHDTKVIAGGVCIPHVQLVSRQIMRVTIPSCVRTVELCENGCNNEYVAVYLATPYGVTNHLHIPVDRSLAATEDQIKAEVESQLDAAVKKYNLQEPGITVAQKDDKTLELTATCVDETCGHLHFEVRPGSEVNVLYNFDGDPRFLDKDVVFSAVPHFGDRFLGELVDAAAFAPLTAAASFPALGDLSKFRDAEARLLHLMDLGISLDDFNGKDELELKLVYYAAITGQTIPERLKNEIKVKVKLRGSDSAASASAPQPAPSGANFVRLPSRLVRHARTESLPMPRATESRSAVDGPRFQYPAPARRLPTPNQSSRTESYSPGDYHHSHVQLAQFSIPLDDVGPTPVEAAPPVPPTQESVTALVEQVEALKLEIANQQAAIQAALDQDGEPPLASTAALAGQSVVNVNIQQPTGYCTWLYGQLECPIAHRMFVRSRECWRNVRDQIPCN